MFIKNIFTNKLLTPINNKAIVVGSSGDLINSNKGGFIDSFPIVIRMNNAPTYGFEKDVGSKTNIRIVAWNALYNIMIGSFIRELINTQALIIWGPNIHMNEVKRKISVIKSFIPSLQIFIFTETGMKKNDELFFKYTNRHRRQSGVWLSTGWFTMFFLFNYIKDKNMIGMGGEKEDVPYHYYDKLNNKQKNYYLSEESKFGSHKFITEKIIFNKWIEEHKINKYLTYN